MNHSRSILRTSPICFGATKNFTVLLSSASGVRLTRSTKALEDFSYVAITSGNVAGAGGILPNSIPPSSACSLAFCSVTNIHASSFAALHLACGFRSDLAAGYALSTRIVVESSFSSWLRNCSFSLMVSSPLRGRGFPARPARSSTARCTPASSEVPPPGTPRSGDARRRSLPCQAGPDFHRLRRGAFFPT